MFKKHLLKIFLIIAQVAALTFSPVLGIFPLTQVNATPPSVNDCGNADYNACIYRVDVYKANINTQGHHTYTLIKVRNKNEFSNVKNFSDRFQQSGDFFITTISGQPELGILQNFGNLISDPGSDNNSGRDMERLITNSKEEIEKLFEAEKNYNDDLLYYPILTGSNTYNSNSYARGMLQRAGYEGLAKDYGQINGDWMPGWNKSIFSASHYQGNLYGFVKDNSGNPIKNANVVLKVKEGDVYAASTTNDNGLYVFGDIPGIRYELIVSYNNFFQSPAVLVNKLQTNRLDITLGSGSQCQPPNCNPTPDEDTHQTEEGANAKFIADTTVPDGTIVGPGTTFVKKWKIQNNGTATWTTSYKLVFQSGNKMNGPNFVNLPQSVSPGQSIDVAVNLTAPTSNGTYRGYWKMQNSKGYFGDILWIDIKVQQNAQPVNLNEQVKFYSQSGFNGHIGSYGLGKNNDPNANSYSMSVPPGWSVKTYKGDNLGSDERCWWEPVSNLQDHGWNNAIQSIEVFNYNACTNGQKVRLFRHANYNEIANEFDPTNNGTNVPNRDTHSMSIPTGWSVRTWSQNEYTGEMRCWTESVPNLQDHGWHLKIDSMRIYTHNECGTQGGSWARICRQTGAHAGTDCHDVTQDIPSLGAANSMGAYSFGNDTVKSVWMSGPWEMMLFEHDNYGGSRYRYRDSNNDIRNFPDNGDTSDYGTSSVKVRKYGEEIVRMYRLGDFNDGDPFKTDNTLDHLGHWDFDNQAKSIRVKPGYEVILCPEANFHGQCGRMKGTDPEEKGKNLNNLHPGLDGNVGSVRICKDECEDDPELPNLLETNDDSNLLPNVTVNFFWGGEGREFQLEISGGNLSSPILSPWMTATTWSYTGLTRSTTPYQWRVQSWNEFGESGWSPSKELTIRDIAPVEVAVAVPDAAEVSTTFSAHAYVTPIDVSNLTYTWSPTPISGQGTATATYNFATAGDQTISVSVANTGATKQASKVVPIMEPVPPCTNVFCVDYFNNTNLSDTPVYSTTEADIDHDWGESGPGNGVNNDNFSARWVGNFPFAADEYRFQTTSDDGVRLYIDNQLVIDNWTNHGPQIDIAEVTLTAGNHEVKMEYYESGYGATAKIAWDLAPEQENCEGYYCVNYFNNTDLSGTPVYSTIDYDLSHDWGGGGPGHGVNDDFFSARWIGNFNFAAGEYDFTAWSDDGVKVFVDGNLIIEDWQDHGVRDAFGNATLTAGMHEVKVEYKEAGGGAIVGLEWEQTTGGGGGSCTPTLSQFCVSYFNNTSLTGTPVYSTTETSIDHDWGGGGPGNGVNNDNFSARWIGDFEFTAGNYTFDAWSDDGIKVWIDNVLLIDDWVDHGVHDVYEDKVLTAGLHEIKVEYKEAGGGAIVGLSWEQTLQGCTTVPNDEFCAEYYNNKYLDGSPAYTNTEEEIGHDWWGSPAPGINEDNFSVRWKGNIHFNAGNNYFGTGSDDGIRLWIDNNLVIDNWTDHGYQEDEGMINLTEGYHEVKLEFYDAGGGAAAGLWWWQ